MSQIQIWLLKAVPKQLFTLLLGLGMKLLETAHQCL